MNLGDILTTQQIVPELKASNRWEAIDELIGALVAAGKIAPENREAVTTVVKKREQSMSTGIGFGIGIPHASTELIGEVVQYEDQYRLCYLRGPAAIIVALSQELT